MPRRNYVALVVAIENDRKNIRKTKGKGGDLIGGER